MNKPSPLQKWLTKGLKGSSEAFCCLLLQHRGAMMLDVLRFGYFGTKTQKYGKRVLRCQLLQFLFIKDV